MPPLLWLLFLQVLPIALLAAELSPAAAVAAVVAAAAAVLHHCDSASAGTPPSRRVLLSLPETPPTAQNM